MKIRQYCTQKKNYKKISCPPNFLSIRSFFWVRKKKNIKKNNPESRGRKSFSTPSSSRRRVTVWVPKCRNAAGFQKSVYSKNWNKEKNRSCLQKISRVVKKTQVVLSLGFFDGLELLLQKKSDDDTTRLMIEDVGWWRWFTPVVVVVVNDSPISCL